MVSDGQRSFDVFSEELGSAERFMKESQFLIYGNGQDKPPTWFMFEKQHMKGLYFNQSPSKALDLPHRGLVSPLIISGLLRPSLSRRSLMPLIHPEKENNGLWFKIDKCLTDDYTSIYTSDWKGPWHNYSMVSDETKITWWGDFVFQMVADIAAIMEASRRLLEANRIDSAFLRSKPIVGSSVSPEALS